ncbi:CBS domain-containing protein [Candidatus Woesearchaeota archaeon]|nr:CBS domain-containing protein [Candidatus Woesearchaeota archaeon]
MKKNKSFWKFVTDIPVSEIMITRVRTINQDDTVFKAVNIMANKGISGLIVVDNNQKPIGIFSEGDIIKKIIVENKDPKKIMIKKIMSKNLKSISPGTSIGKASNIMKKNNISKLPVLKNKKIIGYITKTDILLTTNRMYVQNRRMMVVILINVILVIFIAILLIQLIGK